MKKFRAVIKWVVAIVIICVVAVFLASINGLSVSRTIATVNGNNITEAEYKYYLEVAKNEMLTEAGSAEDNEEFWKTEIDGKLASDVAKERALDYVLRTEIAVVKANEEGITLSDEEKSYARSIINATDSETKEQVNELKKNIGADKYQIADILEKSYLSSAYMSYLEQQENSPVVAEEDEIEAYAEEKYAIVKHVLILNTPSNTATDEEVDADAYKAEAKKKAEDVLAKALKGSNFEDLIIDYGEDPGMESSPNGYIIDESGMTLDGTSMMVPEFTKGSFAVKAGEVNPELVESSYGWHIIKRYPVENSENYSMINYYSTAELMMDKFDEYLDSLKDGLKIDVKERAINKIKVK
ncbi:MAG: peptidylprolyl isomerase [Clostridia bacterium]|nr:peptidylprolyl isomerase [Clostridia bacterium]